MVLGLLALTAIPTTIGVAEGVNAENRENDREKSSEAEQMRKFNLLCYCEPNSPKAKALNGGKIVLQNNKLYIEPQSSLHGHPFEGFYIAYPDPDRPRPPPLGLVSSISNDPLVLNWIYVDKDTREVKYGNRTQSKPHVVGSWSWDAGEEGGLGGVTLEGEAGAVAVETEEGWEVRWEDGVGNVGVGVGVEGKRMLRVSLERKMVDGLEGEGQEDEGLGGVVRKTGENFTLTDTTFKRNRTTTGEPVKGVKATVEKATPKSRKPKLDLNRRIVERPKKKR